MLRYHDATGCLLLAAFWLFLLVCELRLLTVVPIAAGTSSQAVLNTLLLCFVAVPIGVEHIQSQSSVATASIKCNPHLVWE